jgi:hypothetical protein
MRHINVNGHDCTPPELVCPTESKVVEVEGLDIAEAKMEIDP